MDNVVFAADRSPNKTLAGQRRIADRISSVPFLARFCELAVAATVTKREDCGWQIAGDMNLVKPR